MSELHSDLELIRRVMENDMGDEPNPNSPEVKVGMAMQELLSATTALSELASSRSTEPLVRRDTQDIELAYTRLGRMLSRLRQPQLEVVSNGF